MVITFLLLYQETIKLLIIQFSTQMNCDRLMNGLLYTCSSVHVVTSTISNYSNVSISSIVLARIDILAGLCINRLVKVSIDHGKFANDV